jgi:hypothetical protein
MAGAVRFLTLDRSLFLCILLEGLNSKRVASSLLRGRDNDLRAATMQEVFSDPERERDALITFHADDSRLDA